MAAHPITYEEALAVLRNEARSLPASRRLDQCPYCAGLKGVEFRQCAGCLKLLQTGADRSLLSRVVPLTIALEPSAWYAKLFTYKNEQPGHTYFIAGALAARFQAFQSQLEAAMGGPIDFLTITPSSKGRPVEAQQLLRAMQLIENVLPSIEVVLEHVEGKSKPNNRVDASIYTCDTARVQDKRIVLVEDTWVSGASAISAAVLLERCGAKSVVIMPIARRMKISQAAFHPTGAEFCKEIEATRWSPEAIRWPHTEGRDPSLQPRSL